jgi:hypothetical protein
VTARCLLTSDPFRLVPKTAISSGFRGIRCRGKDSNLRKRPYASATTRGIEAYRPRWALLNVSARVPTRSRRWWLTSPVRRRWT